jgi:hypothetical protein
MLMRVAAFALVARGRTGKLFRGFQDQMRPIKICACPAELRKACSCADEINQGRLFDYAKFLRAIASNAFDSMNFPRSSGSMSAISDHCITADAVRAAKRILRKMEVQPWWPADRKPVAAFLDTELDNEQAKMLIARMNYPWRWAGPRGWAQNLNGI